MEVVYDLDTEALATARELGMTSVRAGTVGTREVFVKQLVDLVLERAAIARGEDVDQAVVGTLPAFPSITPNDCCLRVHEHPSGVPALCSEDMHR
jgi:ferrochelatase